MSSGGRFPAVNGRVRTLLHAFLQARINSRGVSADNDRATRVSASRVRPRLRSGASRVKKRKLRFDRFVPLGRGLARFLLKSQLLTIFLALTVLGLVVGLQSRPASGTLPWDELWSAMSVISYRESPADTTARFVVELTAGGRVFSQYDVDRGAFLPPPRGRDYGRTITGTHY